MRLSGLSGFLTFLRSAPVRTIDSSQLRNALLVLAPAYTVVLVEGPDLHCLATPIDHCSTQYVSISELWRSEPPMRPIGFDRAPRPPGA
jgi:hypothetical protein